MDIGVAVIGCGDRGNAHASVWNDRDDSRIIAAYDMDPERAANLARKYNAQVAADYREAVTGMGVTAVSVCVPTAYHQDISCFAAEQGKHIFCEKPLALTREQGKAIVKAVKNNEVVFMPCFQHRDRSPYPQERQLVTDGTLGTPLRFRFTDIRSVRPKPAMHSRSLNGGVVIDMACHMTDMMRHLTREEPTEVFATGSVYGEGKPSLAGVEDLAVDEANIDIAFSGGHRLQMYLNWGLPEGTQSFSQQLLIGPNGYAREGHGVCEVFVGEHAETLPGPDPGTVERINRFVHAIEHSGTADATAEDAFVALEVSLAVLESISQSRVVSL